MKRMHIHISVEDLDKNIEFYSAMFGTQPTVQQVDYAKWRLDEPSINFAVSAKGRTVGLNHLGFELDSDADLEEMSRRIDEHNLDKQEDKGANCCYAESDKYWSMDPQGIPWENFHTLSDIPVYGESNQKSQTIGSQCCAGGSINSQCC